MCIQELVLGSCYIVLHPLFCNCYVMLVVYYRIVLLFSLLIFASFFAVTHFWQIYYCCLVHSIPSFLLWYICLLFCGFHSNKSLFVFWCGMTGDGCKVFLWSLFPMSFFTYSVLQSCGSIIFLFGVSINLDFTVREIYPSICS